MKKSLLATFALAFNLSGAVVTTYTSRTVFESLPVSLTTWDFNGPQGNPVTLLDSLGTDIAGVSTQGGDATGIINSNALCGRTGGLVDCFSPLVLTFLQPVTAFGYDNLDFNGTEEAVVTVAFSGGSAPRQFVFDLGGAPVFTPIFFGITSDENLASVTIYSRNPGSTAVGERANAVDNVTIGASATAVPEPGPFMTLGAGLLAVWGLSRRRLRRM